MNFFNNLITNRDGQTPGGAGTAGGPSAAAGGRPREEAKGGPGATGGAGPGWLSGLGQGISNMQSAFQKQDAAKDYKTSMTFMRSFEGKRVILTGGTGGIGSKVTKKLIKAGKQFSFYSYLNLGAQVVILVQDESKLDQAIKDPKIRMSKSLYRVHLNLKEPYQIEKNFRKALQLLEGQLDSLILCHGVHNHESILNTNLLQWDEIMNVNVRTHFQLVSLSSPFLKLTKGTVVLLSGAQGLTPTPGAILDCTAKAMLNQLVKCAALETAYFGVRVNGVAPGVTFTKAREKKSSMGLTEAQNQKFCSEQQRDVPLQHEINMPQEVANSILWLASEDASYVTGEILVLDGG